MEGTNGKQNAIRNLLYWGLPILAIAMIAVGWIVFSGSNPDLMPSPATVWSRFIKTFTKPIAKTTLIGHAWASLKRVLLALMVAWAFGISFGILIGWNKKARAFFGSIFEVIRLWKELGSTVIFITHNIEEAVYLAEKVLILTNKPAKIKEEIIIDLPRPRNITDPRFIGYRNDITDKIKWW